MLMGSLLIGILASPFPSRSASAAMPLLLGLALLALLVFRPAARPSPRRATDTLALLGVGIAALGFVGMLAKPTVLFPSLQRMLLALQSVLGVRLERLPDTFHPNVVAGAILLLFPFVLVPGLAPGPLPPHLDRVRRALYLGAASIMAAVLILTQSRGAYLGLIVAGLVLSASLKPRLLLLFGPLLCIGGIAAYAILGGSQFGDALVSADPAQGLAWRRQIWAVGWRMAEDMSLTGIGFGQFHAVQTVLYPLPLGEAAGHVHNLYLQILLDLGLGGSIGFLIILGLAWAHSLRALSNRPRTLSEHRHLAAACVASLAGMCTHGLLDAAVWGNKAAWLMWIVLGLAIGLADQETARGRSRPLGDSDAVQ